ncbi:MAG: cytochrome bd ubiquinol oxidase subunit [Acidobacteriota bacterium]|nr:cytochrome bd ubiquinol oxidase subunit [Acidobacteriota bacterium]
MMSMSALDLSRWQFAITAGFHFIFVPLTLGLSILVAYMETRYVRTGDETYLKMARFWGKLFLINFALGVVTGLTMEFQFGMNWAEYSRYVGDIFGAPLAIEATVAFFLESTFIGIWIFGWQKVSKKVHAFSMWMVALGTNLSALWILLANGWMQHPVGYVIQNNRAEMVDFGALVTNPDGWLKFFHTLTSSYLLAAFFVMGVSAYHLLKKSNTDFFKRSFQAAAVFGLVSAFLVIAAGGISAKLVVDIQPTKFAAMEAVWDTQKAAPFALLVIPDEANERNAVETIKIPYLLSLLAHHNPNGEIKGLKEFPKEERPPVLVTFLSYRLMVGLGLLFLLLTFIAALMAWKDKLATNRWFMRIMLYSLPLPYLAAQVGWLVSEIGRQPWLVYGVLKTSAGVSKSISTSQVLASLIGFTILYGALAVIDIFLLAKYAGKGPETDMPGIVKSSDQQEA